VGELSSILIVFGCGAVAGAIVSVVLALLVRIFLNTKPSKEDGLQEASIVIPYSALPGANMNNGVSMADLSRARAAYAAGSGDKKEEPKVNDGMYL